MHRGYVKTYRKLNDSFFYKDSRAVHLWIHLLLKANHEEKSFMFNGEKQTLKMGQMITGIPRLSLETGIGKSKVERLLKCFQNENLIEKQSNNKFSIITITNWKDHQDNGNQNKKPVRNKRETSEKPVRTNNNKEELTIIKKNEEEVNTVDQIIDHLNRTIGSNYKSNTKKTVSLIKSRLDEGFVLEDFIKVHETKHKEWYGTEWEKFLRPNTLYSENFESYLNQKEKTNLSKNTVNNLKAGMDWLESENK